MLDSVLGSSSTFRIPKAILKRACIMVNTTKHIVVKLASQADIMAYPIEAGTMCVKDYCPKVLESFFKDHEARDGVDDLIQRETDLMTDLLRRKDASGMKHEPKPQLPSLKDVTPPPSFHKMSWHEVRNYVETGYARGDVDPYPRHYPEHLKWTVHQE